MDSTEKLTELDLEYLQSEEDDLDQDEARYEIRTLGADFSIELYSQKISSGEIIIPEFQRNYVWPPKKASKLIESFLLGLPVPQVFLYQEASKKDLLVVDGQQRLLTSHYFLTGKFDNGTIFALRGVKSAWEGKTFDDLEEKDKRTLKNYILRATIFEQINPSDNKSVYEIFERLNTGGMPLTEQEVRNCVNQGKINKFLRSINEDTNWRELLGKDEADKRMKDIELILRFFALSEGWQKYTKPMKDFISDFMEKNKDLDDEAQEKLRNKFYQVTKKIHDEIGPNAFRMTTGRINIAVLDSIMVAISNIGPDNITNLKTKMDTLKGIPSYLQHISEATTNDESVTGRIKIAIETFK